MVLSLAFGAPALLALRRSVPEVERPFRLPAAGVLCSLAFGIANCMIYWCGWQTNAVGIGALAALAILFAVVFCLSAPFRELDLQGLIWVVPYMAGLALISWLGQYGGGRGWLPLGVDYFCLVVLTGGVLLVATHVGVDRRDTSARLGLG
jgi:amino acid transporter